MSVGRAVSRWALREPDAVAVFDGEHRETWRELDERTNRLANALAGRFGVAAGDRVALLTHNRLEVAEVLAAVHKAAGVYVGLNFRMQPGELEAALANAEPRVLLAETEFAEEGRRLAALLGMGFVDIDETSSYAELIGASSSAPPPTLHTPLHDDHACIVYTSGTTGAPKGVLFDHAAMTQHATIACIEYGIGPDSRYLVQIPHNSSVNITIAPCLIAGAALGFADSRHFEPAAFADAVAAHAVTHTFLVPTQLMRVLDQLPAADPRLASLTTLGYGSSPIAPDRLGQLVDRFGPIFIQLYGMAEIASIGTLLRQQDHARALANAPRLLGSAGRASIGIDVRVVDEAGADLARGAPGEVVFAGPHVMLGYYRDPRRTAEVLIDGWVHSGDIGMFDDEGYLHIVDRIKNLIIRGGQNIAPTEVENVLYTHPAVLEAAVVGAPDPEWGERIVAVVAPRPGAHVSGAELERFLADADLATIKRPETIRVVDALPKNAVGKIDKKSVREWFWNGERRV